MQNLLLYVVSRPLGDFADFGVPWWAVILNNVPLVSDILFRAIGVYVSVIVAAAVAPKAKFRTALILAVIMGVLLIGGSLFLIFTGIARHPIAAILAEMLLACGAAAIACVQEYGKERERKRLAELYATE